MGVTLMVSPAGPRSTAIVLFAVPLKRLNSRLNLLSTRSFCSVDELDRHEVSIVQVVYRAIH
jgi:hypothetical protein